MSIPMGPSSCSGYAAHYCCIRHYQVCKLVFCKQQAIRTAWRYAEEMVSNQESLHLPNKDAIIEQFEAINEKLRSRRVQFGIIA